MAINELGNYLRARRQAVSPTDVGLASQTGRRVTGLRREEVADLAGISSDYYLRLEQGRDTNPSNQVLRSLAKALLLDEEATTHLQRIADPPPNRSFAPLPGDLDDSVFDFLAGFEHMAAYVINGCQDVLACNDRANRLLPYGFYVGANLFDALFHDITKQVLPNWDNHVLIGISSLRARADPDDPRLHELVGRLLVTQPEFAEFWGRHDVGLPPNGVGTAYVEGFGLVEMQWQNLAVPADPRLLLVATFAEPGTLAAEALASLGD